MNGQIYAYSESACAGIIKDTAGHRYLFTRQDWIGKRPPANDMKVTFVAQSGLAVSVAEEIK